MILKFFKKADFILIGMLILIGIGSFFIVSKDNEAGKTVIIKDNGKLYGRYSLNEDRNITIANQDKKNVITIKNNTVIMKEANCKNQLCVNHKAINKSGESIICLPNRIAVEIKGDKGDEYDSISK